MPAMTAPDRARVRDLLLDALAGGAPASRSALLRRVADRWGIDPRKRSLRAIVARELRALEDEGRLVDGGPEVWLRQDGPSRGEGGPPLRSD